MKIEPVQTVWFIAALGLTVVIMARGANKSHNLSPTQVHQLIIGHGTNACSSAGNKLYKTLRDIACDEPASCKCRCSRAGVAGGVPDADMGRRPALQHPLGAERCRREGRRGRGAAHEHKDHPEDGKWTSMDVPGMADDEGRGVGGTY